MDLEELFQKQIRSLDDTVPPDSTWNKENTWDRIKHYLGGSRSGKVYFHYYLAASISFFLLFSGILTIYQSPDVIEKIGSRFGNFRGHQLSQNQPNPEYLARKLPEASFVVGNHELGAIDYRPGNHAKTFALAPKSVDFEPDLLPINNPSYVQKIAFKEKPRISFTGQLGAGFVSDQFTPKLNFRTAALLPRNESSYHSVGLSLTSFAFIESSETGDTEFNPGLFVNAEYGRVRGPLRKWANRSWEIGVGYLVADRSTVFKDNTIRIFTRLPLSRRLKLVPELILTNNFKSVLPGITLTLG